MHYNYGEYGERTLMEEKSGSTVMASTSYSYDTYKRLSSETRSFNGLSGSFSVGYTYNYADALKQVSYTVGAWSKSVNYDYNYAGAPTQIGSNLRTGNTANNVATAFDFRAWGALQKADYANGRRLALGYNQKRSQLTNLKLQKTDNSDVVTNISYDYYNGGGGSGGNNGRVRYITDHLDGNYSVDVGYDDYNRLTSYGSYRSYTYDAWNNLLSVSSSNGVGEAPNYTLTYATNGSGAPSTNRINNSGYTFDNAGNVTNDGSLAYAYDAAGRLKTAGTNNSCEYDGDGRKVKQVSGGYPLFYLWSSVLGEPVVELDGSGGVYRAYVLSSGGGMLAVQSYDGGFYWLHTDHLGNGRKLTNSSGTVIYRAEFDPHGQMLYEWQSSGQTYLNSHKFTGYERDWATNLNYAKARTYNHNRARFMQPDPLGLGAADTSNPQSLNRYSYVENDPMNSVDPSGLLLVRFCTADQWIPSEAGGELISGICYLVEFGYGGFGGGPIGPIHPIDPVGPTGTGGDSGKNEKDHYAFVACTLDAALNAGIGLIPGGGIIKAVLTDYLGVNFNPFQYTMGKEDLFSGPSDIVDSAKISSAAYKDIAEIKYAAAGGDHAANRAKDLVNRGSFEKLSDSKKQALQGKLDKLTKLGKVAKAAPIIAQLAAVAGFLKDTYKCYNKYLK